MDGRRNVYVNHKIYIDGLKIPSTITLLTEELNKIPEDQREKAVIDVDCYEEYGSSRCDISIQYSRLETDKEYEERLDREKVWNDRRIAEAKKLLGIKE